MKKQSTFFLDAHMDNLKKIAYEKNDENVIRGFLICEGVYNKLRAKSADDVKKFAQDITAKPFKILSNIDAIMRAEGIIDKALWLCVNLHMTRCFSNQFDIQKTVTFENQNLNFTCANAYIILMNFWFGIEHTLDESIKVNTRDYPKAVVKALLFLFVAINDPTKQIDMITLKRVHEVFINIYKIHNILIKMYHQNSKGNRFSPFFSDEQLNVDITWELSVSEIHNMLRNGNSYDTFTSDFNKEYDMGIIVYSCSIIQRIFTTYIENVDLFKKTIHFAAYIFQWINQNLMWAWGGIEPDMSTDTIIPNFIKDADMNIMPNFEYAKVKYNKQYVELDKDATMKLRSHDKLHDEILNLIKSTKLFIEVPVNGIPNNHNEFNNFLSMRDSNFASYRVAVLAAAHPIFGVHVINMPDLKYEDTEIWDFLKNSREDIIMAQQKTNLYTDIPHLACLRLLNVQMDISGDSSELERIYKMFCNSYFIPPKTVVSLTQENEQIRKAYDEQIQINSTIRTENDTLKQFYNQHTALISKYENKINETNQQIAVLQSEKVNMQQKLSTCMTSLKKAQARTITRQKCTTEFEKCKADLNAFTIKNQQISDQLAIKEHELASLNSANTQRITDLQAQIAKTQQEKTDFQANITELKVKVKFLSSKMENITTERDTCTNELAVCKTTITRLNSDIQNIQKKYSLEEETHKIETTASNAAFQTKRTELERDLLAKNQELDALREELKKYSMSMSTFKDRLSRLNALEEDDFRNTEKKLINADKCLTDLDNANNKIRSITLELTSKTEEFATANRLNADALALKDHEINELNTVLKDNTQKIDELNTLKIEFKRENTELQTQNSALKNERDVAIANTASVNSQLDNMQLSFAQKSRELTENLETAKNGLRTAQTELDNCKQASIEIAQKHALCTKCIELLGVTDIETAKATKVKLDKSDEYLNDLQKSSAKVTQLTNDVRQIQVQLAAKEHELADLNAASAQKEKDLQTQIKTIQDEKDAAVASAAVIQRNFDSLQRSESAELQKRTQDALHQSEVQVLNDKITSFNTQIDSLKQQLQQSINALGTATSSADAMANENANLKADIKNKDSELANLTQFKSDTTAQMTNLTGEKTTLTHNLDVCAAELNELKTRQVAQQQTISTLTQQVQQLTVENQTLNSKLVIAHQETVTASERCLKDDESAKATLAVYNAKIDSLTQQLDGVNILLNDLKQQVATENAKTLTLSSELKQSQDKIALLEPELSLKKEEIDAQKSNIQTLETKLTITERDLQTVSAQLATATHDLQEKTTALSESVRNSSQKDNEKTALEISKHQIEEQLKDAANEANLAAAKIAKLEKEYNTATIELENKKHELGQILSGTHTIPMPSSPHGGPPPYIGTNIPIATEQLVSIPAGALVKTSMDRLETMALGTACGSSDRTKMPVGCMDIPATNVTCDTPVQVKHAVCNYSSIPVPIDLQNTVNTYDNLDVGSKVKMQLIEAAKYFEAGKSLILKNSGVVLDRSLVPLRKVYGYDKITENLLAGGIVATSNAQYAQYLDANASSACRLVFNTIFGTTMPTIPTDKLVNIGLETITTSVGIAYKVINGPFSVFFRKTPGDIVNPMQLVINSHYYSTTAKEFLLTGDNYTVPGISHNAVAITEGNRNLLIAIRHLINAAATYIGEVAYNEKTPKIGGAPGVPAGAFAMLPRPDINALLAIAILYPRTVNNSKVPAFADFMSLYEKDETGSRGSLMCAAGCEVLQNYSRESTLNIGELGFEAKANPQNIEIVITEAAKRVAEIVKLAESMK